MSIELIPNAKANRKRRYGRVERAIQSLEAGERAHREIRTWPGYFPTRLLQLPGLAVALDVAEVVYKDEGERFGLGSFKALGGAYGVLGVLSDEIRGVTGRPVTGADLLRGDHAEIVRSVTVTCATDGNHGRAVAWGASLFGCRSVIYLAAHVSRVREAAIASHGAEIVRVDGSYDDAVRQAQADASRNGLRVVSDTSYADYERIPRRIMQGYSILMKEALAQLSGERPTHVFVQAGVGGLAAAMAAYLWERYGPRRPAIILVEPEGAACLFETVRAGELTPFGGKLETVMGCLSCGEASPLAWRILEHASDFAATIPDALAPEGMRVLAEGLSGDPPVVAGESAVAGVMAAREVAHTPRLRDAVGLTTESRLLVIGTEGATDPEMYAALVGRPPEHSSSGA